MLRKGIGRSEVIWIQAAENNNYRKGGKVSGHVDIIGTGRSEVIWIHTQHKIIITEVSGRVDTHKITRNYETSISSPQEVVGIIYKITPT